MAHTVLCNCPRCTCGKILFNQIDQHVKDKHDLETLSNDLSRKFVVKMLIPPLKNWLKDNTGVNVMIRKLQFCNEIFYYTGKVVDDRYLYLWIYYLGSLKESKQFSYKLKVGFSNKIKFEGQVLSLDLSHEHIIREESTFVISQSQIKKILEEYDQEYLPIQVSIRNLKEEAKNENEESGVSDISD